METKYSLGQTLWLKIHFDTPAKLVTVIAVNKYDSFHGQTYRIRMQSGVKGSAHEHTLSVENPDDTTE